MLIHKVALYARFSSDNQRTESIDAQVRAMKKYCQQNSWQIVETYVDEARSATTDKRPNFQRMIEDSGKGIFDIVLVHKLDRFSRNRYDSAIYKSKLKKNHVNIFSVLERIDDSPESVMMEAMLEGMAEYYSKNLSREVMKGMNETALQCKHTGGIPPLGYDLNSDRKLVINKIEAEAVKIIFSLFDEGYGYTHIIDILNQNGYKTKCGKMFGKNSLYEILGNEKYTGTFVFNRSASRNDCFKRNNHKMKAYDDVIRIENGCPQIISKELFQSVQKRRLQNKHNAGSYHSKEFYLLTGKIFCGVCGKKMQGNLRFSGSTKARLSTYRCNTHRSECRNKEINKDYLDAYIIDLLAQKLLNPQAMKRNIQRINRYISRFNTDFEKNHSVIENQYHEILHNLKNITAAIEKGLISDSLFERMEQLEEERISYESRLQNMNPYTPIEYTDFSYLIDEFHGLERETESFRTFVQRYIISVTVFPYQLEIVLNTGLGIDDSLNETVKIKRGELYEKFESHIRKDG